MFDPNNYVMPKISRKEQMLRNHGYYESTIRDGVRSLTPTCEGWKKMADIDNNASDDEIFTCYIMSRHDFDIFSEKDESFKDWMLRLGWLIQNPNGHIVEADHGN